MSNPFQDQLLKAGVVSKQQVNKVNQEKHKKKKQHKQLSNKDKNSIVDKTKLKVQQEAEDKAKRDRELNQRKEDHAKQKAISIEINNLISENCVDREENCDIVYNFEHQKKVKRIYVNEEMKQQIIKGLLGIARIEGRYELIPKPIAEKVQQRNEKRVVLITKDSNKADENDPYADYQIPDDLTW